MTVSSTVNRASYTAVGGEGSIVVPFSVQRNGDLLVYRTETGGIPILLVYGTDYTIPYAQLGQPTGSITLTVPAVADDIFQMWRVLPLLQDVDLQNQGAYLPETMEIDALDRIVEMVQQTNSLIDDLTADTGGSFLYDTVVPGGLPVASAANAGQVYRIRDTGIQDRFVVSAREDAGTFTWLSLAVSPSVSVDNAVVRFNGITGEATQSSPVIIGDDGSISGVEDFSAFGNLDVGSVSMSGNGFVGGTLEVTDDATLIAGLTVGAALDVTGDADFDSAVSSVGDWSLEPGFGSSWVRGSVSEELTIAAAATTSSSILLPANSVIEAVTGRVNVVIPTASTFQVGVSGSAARFATGVSTTATTQFVGLTHVDQTGAAGPTQTSSAAVLITPSLTPASATGTIRLVIYFRTIVAPSS